MYVREGAYEAFEECCQEVAGHVMVDPAHGVVAVHDGDSVWLADTAPERVVAKTLEAEWPWEVYDDLVTLCQTAGGCYPEGHPAVRATFEGAGGPWLLDPGREEVLQGYLAAGGPVARAAMPEATEEDALAWARSHRDEALRELGATPDEFVALSVTPDRLRSELTEDQADALDDEALGELAGVVASDVQGDLARSTTVEELVSDRLGMALGDLALESAERDVTSRRGGR